MHFHLFYTKHSRSIRHRGFVIILLFYWRFCVRFFFRIQTKHQLSRVFGTEPNIFNLFCVEYIECTLHKVVLLLANMSAVPHAGTHIGTKPKRYLADNTHVNTLVFRAVVQLKKHSNATFENTSPHCSSC